MTSGWSHPTKWPRRFPPQCERAVICGSSRAPTRWRSRESTAALARARLYREAGADAIFPEALTTEEMFRTFAREIDAPLLANMTEFGRTPYFTAKQFEDFGFAMVIWPVSSLRVAAKAIDDLYECLMREGGAEPMLDRMQTRAQLYETIGYNDYEALDESIARSVVPPDVRVKSMISADNRRRFDGSIGAIRMDE